MEETYRRHVGVDQYGSAYWLGAHPRKELCERLQGQHIQKMYCDNAKTGQAAHVGYVIAGLWVEVFRVTPLHEMGRRAKGGGMRWQQEYFEIWSISREDIANAFKDDDDSEPDWPHELSDAQMCAVANRMLESLEGSMDWFWDSLRAAVETTPPDVGDAA